MVLKASGNRDLPEDQLPGLDIAMPYLAGTYDERMFDDSAPVHRFSIF